MPDHMLAKDDRQLGILESDRKGSGREEAVNRMAPARQGFEANDLTCLEVDFRLIEWNDPTLPQGFVNVLRACRLLLGILPHVRLIDGSAVAAERFGRMKGQIRILHQV